MEENFSRQIRTPLSPQTRLDSNEMTQNNMPENADGIRSFSLNNQQFNSSHNLEEASMNTLLEQKKNINNRVFQDMMTQHNKLYKVWRRFDLLCAIFSVFAFMLALIEYEYGFDKNPDKRVKLDYIQEILRFMIIGFSLISFALLVTRYYYKRKWQNLPIPKEVQYQVYNNDYTNLMRQNKRKNFMSLTLVIDSIICLICPLPFVEHLIVINENVHLFNRPLSIKYLLSDFILMFMFTRIYILVRNIFNHTEFSDPYAKLHCERYGFTAGTRFCFKCYLSKYPGMTVMGTLTLSVMYLSYLMRIAERPAWIIYREWPDVGPIYWIYLVIITMTTVGFGDFYPLTIVGKIITVLTALWGGFIIGLLIVSVTEIFSLSPTQKVAFDKLVKVKRAAKCIIAAMKYQVAKNKNSRNRQEESLTSSGITNRLNKNSISYEMGEKRTKKYLMRKIQRFRDINNRRSSRRNGNINTKIENIENRVENLEELMRKSYSLLHRIARQNNLNLSRGGYNHSNYGFSEASPREHGSKAQRNFLNPQHSKSGSLDVVEEIPENLNQTAQEETKSLNQ
ncbi:unnamed protein product [Moneuplotes crassus]|uniref:Potassium channel domain-containing protein n=1 Tax=Euplotes crassus TaxID=5936 RepID=A0AAD1U601_EUPCR|nr:unnamed protein product [Moneuplotes crassus]